jgi:Flp pilus assembly protein TadD
LAQQDRIVEAEDRLRESLRLDPGDAQTHYNLGFLLANRGELREAERHLAEAVRLAPNDVANRQALGAIRGRLRANPSR